MVHIWLQDNARRAAERKYSAALHKAGLDEQFVYSKSASASGVDTYGEVSDQEDDYLVSSGGARNYSSASFEATQEDGGRPGSGRNSRNGTPTLSERSHTRSARSHTYSGLDSPRSQHSSHHSQIEDEIEDEIDEQIEDWAT